MNRANTLQKRIRTALTFFIIALVLSGLTAFPLQTELDLLTQWLGAADSSKPEQYPGLTHWIVKVRDGLHDTNTKYPFMAYGTDWLAFAHIVIAIFFIGPLLDPARNTWVIVAGMIACVLVIPLAMICGAIRGIPFYWRLIDCSFGILGFVPLWFCWKQIRELQALSDKP